MKSICGADCDKCTLFNKQCKGCKITNGCSFGKKCWIANYIEIGGKDNYELLKKKLIDEFNNLEIAGLPKIKDLYPLHGLFVNLEYTLPSGEKVKLLLDNEAYLGNQVACEFNDGSSIKCFGLLANMNFLLISEYEENGVNPEIIIYRKR